MSSPTLRHIIQAIAILVWVRHVAGAARIFSPAKGEHLPPAVQLFPIAMTILVFRLFRTPLETRLVIPGVMAFVGSLLLFEWARKSVRGKFFSYIYSHDTPQFLWTSGPYAYIRNPFYASYLLSYIGAAMMFPGATAYVVVGAMIVFFSLAARHEERKFKGSPLAAEYEAYRRRTGRFIPRWGGISGTDTEF